MSYPYRTRKGIISPKLQLLSGHSEENSLAIYCDLALTDVAADLRSRNAEPSLPDIRFC
jgi:hypothetical protein